MNTEGIPETGDRFPLPDPPALLFAFSVLIYYSDKRKVLLPITVNIMESFHLLILLYEKENMSDTIVGTILGVVIGWLLNHCTANSIVKRQEFYKAAAAFRVAFVDEYRSLKSIARPEDIDDNFVMNMLSEAVAKHEKACIMFRPYLTGKQIRAFDKAWHDYLVPKGGEIADLPNPFIDYCCESNHESCIKLALEKMDVLMEFAKPA